MEPSPWVAPSRHPDFGVWVLSPLLWSGIRGVRLSLRAPSPGNPNPRERGSELEDSISQIFPFSTWPAFGQSILVDWPQGHPAWGPEKAEEDTDLIKPQAVTALSLSF